MKAKYLSFLTFIAVLMLSHCASVVSKYEPRPSGKSPSETERESERLKKEYESNVKNPEIKNEDILVYEGSFAIEGLEYDGSNHHTNYGNGYNHTFLGEFTDEAGGLDFFWPNYRDPGRLAYCRVNNVLSIGTLLVWWWASPFNYFCFPGKISGAEREADAKAMAKAMGGDLVLLPQNTSSQQGRVILINKRTGIVWRMDPRVRAKLKKK
jgi:hypothetical protein